MKVTNITHDCAVPVLPDLGDLSKLHAYWTCPLCSAQWSLYKWKKDGLPHVYSQNTKITKESKAWRKAKLAYMQSLLDKL